jgi:hypothetical protein
MIVIVSDLVKKFPHFTEPDPLFPVTQEPAKCAYCKSDESILRRTIIFFSKFIFILYSYLRTQPDVLMYMKQCVRRSFGRFQWTRCFPAICVAPHKFRTIKMETVLSH